MKNSLTRMVCVLLATGVWWISPALAQTDLSGQAKGGAFYSISVPAAWNGDLVIWNHGYEFSPISPNPSLGPLAPVQLAQGYAVAASSYRMNQWGLFRSRRDLENLVETFNEEVGAPNNIIMTGASLGGIVTADALERSKVHNVVGAFAFCGAMAGSRVWDGAFDIRLTYDAICGGIAPIPGGSTGLPEVPGIIDPFVVALATNACMGTLVPPAARTPLQQDNLDRFLNVTKIPENFIVGDMVFATNGMANLIWDERKLDGGQGLGNIGVEYDDAGVNATIERVAADKKPARILRQNFTPKGNLREPGVKIVSLHTDKDGLVIVENEKEYQDVVNAGNLTVGIAVEAVPTHCGFSEAEIVTGWESLRGWIAGAPQPSAAVLQGTCQFIEGTGAAAGPCRIDPTFVIPDMDGRIAPRGSKKKHK